MQPPIENPLNPTVIAAVIAFFSAVVIFACRKCLDRRSINRALLAEIKRLIHVVTLHRDWWDRLVRDGDTDDSLIPFSHAVYTAQVENIGELRGGVVARAVTFYGSLDFINALQAARPLYDVGKNTQGGEPLKDVFNRQYLDRLNGFIREAERDFAEELHGAGSKKT